MPRHFTICLLVLAALLCTSSAFAGQKVVDVIFARDVADREPVKPFEPPAYCEREAEPSSPVPVLDSQTEGRVVLWNRIEAPATAALRHTWYKDGVKVAEVILKVQKSPGFRTWSSKKIVPRRHAGKWKVVVSTAIDPPSVLCAAHFVVK